MSQRQGQSIRTAIAAMLLLLGGCEAIYEDTKGWANRLEASVLESVDQMSEEPAPKEPSYDKPAQTAVADASQAAVKSPMATPKPPLRKPAMKADAVPAQPVASNKAPQQTVSKPSGMVGEAADALVDPAETPKNPKTDKQKTPAGSAATQSQLNSQAAASAPAVGDKAAAKTSAETEPAKHKSDTAMVLHLSSLRSEQAAKREWGDLQRAFPEPLGTMDAEFRKTELGSKGTFYRVLVGPLKSRSAAKEACAALKAKNDKQYCRVIQAKPKA